MRELLDFHSEDLMALDMDEGRSCVFEGSMINHYFDADGYYEGPGRSLESMASTHSIQGAQESVASIEESRPIQDALDADIVGD